MKTFHCLSLLSVMLFAVLPCASLFAVEIHPPWTPPPQGGVRFTVPCVSDVPDLHGDMNNPDLVIFFGGNQFMVLSDLMEAFRKQHPQYEKIYYQTLPPGILEQQIRTGSLVTGNLKITVRPDVFVAGEELIKEMNKEGYFDKALPYLSNRLAIMVGEGNPKQIRSLSDLGREDVRVSMPNPETEGVAEKIMEAYRKAEGESLVTRIMDEKARKGTTFITQIHHRQTPMRIMEGESDAGPVWYTEVAFQQKIGNPIDLVDIPDEHNVTGTTAAAVMKDAAHKEAATHFLEFLETEQARSIYKEYGFLPVKD